MIHRVFPWAMGLMMGLMLPFVIHAGAGLAFVLAHVAVVGAVLVAATFLPLPETLRTVIASHRPSLRHFAVMALAVGIGFGAICLYCLSVGGTHHA